MPTLGTEDQRESVRETLKRRSRAGSVTMEKDPRWRLVERIAESRSLGRSVLLGDFLRYVADRQIRGKDAEITEQQIGVQVFGRAEGYNSNDDNIVRNYARTLRKRLDEYFRREGIDEALVVVIPRGGYVPVFQPRESYALASVASSLQVSPEDHPDFQYPETDKDAAALREPREALPPRPVLPPEGLLSQRTAPDRPTWRSPALVALALLVAAFLIGLGGFVVGKNAARSRMPDAASRNNQILWRSLFENNRDTFVVPADGGLVMLQSFTRKKVTLPEYVNGSYRSTDEISQGTEGLLKTNDAADHAQVTHKVSVLAARRYTSMVDLELSTRLARLNDIAPERLTIRFARDFRIDDLRTGNAILIGSADANPWVSLFEQQLNFQFAPGKEFGGSGTIRNMHPLAGEESSYASITGDPSNRTYGVIAYVPNLEGTGHVLLIEGVNMAGTQAAGDFLLNPEKMQPLLDRARERNGSLRSFEVLIETTSVAANASTAKVIGERIRDARAG